MNTRSSVSALPLVLLLATVVAGCGGGEAGDTGGRQFLSMGTAPVGGAFPVVGGAISEVNAGSS